MATYAAEETPYQQELFRASLCVEECPMRRAIATGKAAGPADVEILTRDGVELTVSVSAAALSPASSARSSALSCSSSLLRPRPCVRGVRAPLQRRGPGAG